MPLVIDGIIPLSDAATLKTLGLAAFYTPKNFELDAIIGDIVGLVERSHGIALPPR